MPRTNNLSSKIEEAQQACSNPLSQDAILACSMARMATFLSSCIILVTTAYACLIYERSPVFERPVQSSIVVLAFSGLLSLISYRLIPSALFPASRKPPSPTLPYRKESLWRSRILTIQNPWRAIGSLPSQLRRQLIISACTLCAIVAIFQIKLTNRQCLENRYEASWGFLPFLLLIFNRSQQWEGICQIMGYGKNSPSLGCSIQSSQKGLSQPGERALLAISCFGLGVANTMTRYDLLVPSSTYVCPSSSHMRGLAPWIDILNLYLWYFLLRNLTILIERAGSLSNDQRGRPYTESVGYVFIIASSILFAGGSIICLTQPMNWQWLFNFDHSFVLSLCWHSLVLAAFVLAAIEIVISYGAVNSVSLVVYTAAFVSGILRASNDPRAFAPAGLLVHWIYIFILCSSPVLYLISGGAGSWEEQQRPRIEASKFTYLILVFVAITFAWSTRDNSLTLNSHPIWSDITGVSSLIQNAGVHAFEWEKQAQSSRTLHEAVTEYWRRYSRYPPPGFDAWYRYAVERNSVIIDDFDSIYEDLKPFWGIDAAKIRMRTAQVMSDTWNDISEIRIRNGTADLGPNFKPTHRWMLEGILSMIQDFSLFLPDMDLAFNLNDEPRVTIPFSVMQGFQKATAQVKNSSRPNSLHWSTGRDIQWDTLAEVQPTRPFTNVPRINSFTGATLACSPASKARTSFLWNPRPLCTACFAPHSVGPFLSDWTTAASPCHQPDLRNLHGFYLSPAAFKTTQILLPIFSQAKVAGFADILYPSPWNYIGKAVYAPDNTTHPDPPFAQKQNTLFWRGGTSEGVSRFGTWKGMARQRLVHLANKPTSSVTSQRLIHHPNKPGKFTYTTTNKRLEPLPVSLNISIVAEFARAWDNDGAAQAAEFSLAPPVNFQHHWHYRYLFDTDGAGFSGRFIPFLHSRSLPFRAGIFRAWYDARLTAWQHFVPVDIRLHGLIATLEYFAGTMKQPGGDKGIGQVGLEGDLVNGERIAEAGREWAGKVLRKEDMEIYMFRLLLEWGRLTDDRREEIGFAMPT